MEKFFTHAWFDMVGSELRALLQEQSQWQGCSWSVVEYFRAAPPLGLSAPFELAGLRLDLDGGKFLLRRGLLPNEQATLVVHSYWDDAAVAACMTSGARYQRFCHWRAAAGRLDMRGEAGDAAPLLAMLHDRIAGRTTARYDCLQQRWNEPDD